jgi:hypothetical protein
LLIIISKFSTEIKLFLAYCSSIAKLVKMVREYPFKWVDIPEEERKAAMPAGFVDYVRLFL